MRSTALAQLGEILYLHLDPDEDLYGAIEQAIKDRGWRSGLVLTITGALSRTELSLPVASGPVTDPPGHIQLDGTAEVTGTGYFGTTEESWSSPTSMIDYRAGDPFIHVHLVASVGGSTYEGHLLRGCLVRAVHPVSHFIVVIAHTIGADLTYHRGEDEIPGYPNGVPFYRLREVG